MCFRLRTALLWTLTQRLVVISYFLDSWPLKKGPRCCPETSVRNFTFMWPCIVTNFFTIKPTRYTNFANLFWHETLHVSTVRLSIIRILFTVHTAMAYVIQIFRQLSSRTRMELQFHPGPARKLSTNLCDIYSVQCTVNKSWWWTEELSETCRFSCQNKFLKYVHLVGFIMKKAGEELPLIVA